MAAIVRKRNAKVVVVAATVAAKCKSLFITRWTERNHEKIFYGNP